MAVDVTQTEGQLPAGRVARVVEFYHGVMREMRKVTWPDVPQVRDATVKIIIFVLFLALLITILDTVLSGLLQFIVSMVSGT